VRATKENNEMLSERQMDALVYEINKDYINLPFVSEQKEKVLIEKYAKLLHPHIYPALELLCGKVYADTIQISINEELSIEQRRKQISSLLKSKLSVPLVQELNAKFDISRLLPEKAEAFLLKIAVDKIIILFVKWVIGELDEKLDELDDKLDESLLASSRAGPEMGGSTSDGNINSESSGVDDDMVLFLSDRQVQGVVYEMNKDIDIPFINEAKVGKIIQKYVDLLHPQFGAALDVICGKVYGSIIKTALDVKLSLGERHEQISALLRDRLSVPLARELNDKVDVFSSVFLTEKMEDEMEGRTLKFIVDKMIFQFVKWIVSQLDDKIKELLTRSSGGEL